MNEQKIYGILEQDFCKMDEYDLELITNEIFSTRHEELRDIVLDWYIKNQSVNNIIERIGKGNKFIKFEKNIKY